MLVPLGDKETGADTSLASESSTAVGPVDAALAASMSLDARLCGLDVLLSVHFKYFAGPLAPAIVYMTQRGTNHRVVLFAGGIYVAY